MNFINRELVVPKQFIEHLASRLPSKEIRQIALDNKFAVTFVADGDTFVIELVPEDE